MSKEWNAKFSEIVNMLEINGQQFAVGKLTREQVVEMTDRLLDGMNEEQLDALIEYQRERQQQNLQTIEVLQERISEAETELARRKKSGTT